MRPILTYDRIFPAATPADQRAESMQAARDGRHPRIFLQRKDMQQMPSFPQFSTHGLGLLPTATGVRNAAGFGPVQIPTPATMAWSGSTARTALTQQQVIANATSSQPGVNDPGFVQSADTLAALQSPVVAPPSAPWYTVPWMMFAAGAGVVALGAAAVYFLKR